MLSAPGQVNETNSWHLLWTTKEQTYKKTLLLLFYSNYFNNNFIILWHWNPCLPKPQMKSLQWEQNLGCLKNLAANLCSFIMKAHRWRKAPRLANLFIWKFWSSSSRKISSSSSGSFSFVSAIIYLKKKKQRKKNLIIIIIWLVKCKN